MQYLNSDLYEEPVDFGEFSILEDTHLPKIIAGIPVHNRYDQKRINLHKDYNPINAIQIFPKDGSFSFLLLKGMEITPKETILPLLNNLSKITNLTVYKNLLFEYKFKCENCAHHFNPNIFPIDAKYINQISKNPLKEIDLYEKILITDLNPVYQSFGYFSIFILTALPQMTDFLKKEINQKLNLK